MKSLTSRKTVGFQSSLSRRTSSRSVVKIQLVALAAAALMPVGEYPLILCGDFAGDLPKVEIMGGEANQHLSLKKTPRSLLLVVNP